MTRQVIIRDDDISYFTQPERLEKIYNRLWKRGYQVCLSVIPCHRANVRVEHRKGQPYDPCIPPQYRGQDRQFSILDNPDLCEFLNEKAKQGLVKICLHGYSHNYMEFTSDDPLLIQEKLQGGLNVLNRAFPSLDIDTFIAPYDNISPIATRLVFDNGLNFCIASHNLKAIPQFQHIGAYEKHQIDDCLLYTCDEYLFTHHEDAEICIANARERLKSYKLVIVANHYWNFYTDWNGDNQPLQDVWTQFVDDLLGDDSTEIVTF